MKKSRISLSIIFILVLSLTLSVSAFAYDVAAELRDVSEIPADLTGKIVILHSNDVHGAIDGYAYIAYLRSVYESRGAEVILVDAGDYSQGDPRVSIYKGATAFELMNAAGYNYATLGNHEFDYGFESLMENINSANFKVLCADVFDDGKTILTPHDVYTSASGVKIGFFGMETPETLSKIMPGLVTQFHFASNTNGKTELYDVAQGEINALKDEGSDLVIGIFHLGLYDESAPDGHRSIDVYKATSGIDFIIDAHSHTVMSRTFDGAPIQSTGTKFAYVGVVVIDSAKKQVEDSYLISTEGLEKDPAVSAVSDRITAEVNAAYGAPFAKSEVTLNGAKAPQGNRDSETNNGDLITDSMLWNILNVEGSLKVDNDHVVAVTNGGGIRAAINPGDVSMKDVNTVLPFGNTLAVIYVKGSELLEAMEASTFSTPIGGYPQTAGIKWTLDMTKEYDANDETYPDSTYYGPKSINRVTIHSINGKPFDPEDVYAVVTNNFCAAGGDTYFVFKNASDQFDTGIPLDEALMTYITEELDGVISAEKYAEPRGDVTIITAAPEPAAEEPAATEPVKPAEETPKTEEEYYTVVAGDCLWKIAKRYYGDGAKWGIIYKLNTDSIKDPSLIYIGQKIRVR